QNLYRFIMAQYNVQPKLHIHTVTGNTYRSPLDAYSNLLRDTVAAIAATLGGSNSLFVRPFDEMIKEPDSFSYRMGRNIQLLLKEESYQHKIADAGAGSYYIETLTEEMPGMAWEAFKVIASQGGLSECFNKNIIQENVKQQADKWLSEYRT